MRSVAYYKYREETKVVLLLIIMLILLINCYLQYCHNNTVKNESIAVVSIAEVLGKAEIIITE